MNFFKLIFRASVHGFIFGGPKIWGLDKIEKYTRLYSGIFLAFTIFLACTLQHIFPHFDV